MTSHSPTSVAATKPFNAPTLTLEAAAFIGLFLGLVYFFARNYRARSTQRPRNKKRDEPIADRGRTHRVTEFLIS